MGRHGLSQPVNYLMTQPWLLAAQRFPLLRALLLALAGVGTIAQGAIFGDGNPHNGIEDQRSVSALALLDATGTIYCNGGLRGTAAHVIVPGADVKTLAIIVTAAHVLVDSTTGDAFDQCHYRPKNQRFDEVAFKRTSAHQFDPQTDNKIEQAETDIAFVELVKPLRQPALRLAIAPPNNPVMGEQSLLLIGYNSDLDKITSSADCELFTSAQFASDALLLHNCDATRGASGGPIISVYPGGESHFSPSTAEIIAVHGGTFFLNSRDGSPDSTTAPEGAVVDPERWINQARKIDPSLLQQLQHFTAYPAKDSRF